MPGVPHPPVVRPINYVKIATTTVAILGGVSVLAVAGPYLLPLIQSRNLWAAISIISILLFISGHVFNHIRKMPYVGGDGRGGVSYFRPSAQEQFGLESQIVAAMCELHANICDMYMLTLQTEYCRLRPLLSR